VKNTNKGGTPTKAGEGTMREDYVVDGKSEDSNCYSLLKHKWQANTSNKRENYFAQ